MHSFLIYGGTQDSRLDAALNLAQNILNRNSSIESEPDFFKLEIENKTSFGIEEIRQLQRELNQKPFNSKAKVALIPESSRLTPEAQNALLKTLEEPPGRSYIILTAKDPSLLLPTVVSRCAPISLASSFYKELTSQEKKLINDLSQLLSQGYRKRLDYLEENRELFSDREAALVLLDTWLKLFSKDFFLKESSHLNLLETAWKLLKVRSTCAQTTASPRNLVEIFFLGVPENILEK